MDVRILGPFEIAEGSRVLRVNGVKPRAVMAMLALQVNRVVSTNHLIDGLWGDSPPENASAAAQVYISRLRKALSPDVSTPGRVNDLLRRRPPGYVLHLDPEQVDLHRFHALAREGMRVLPTAPRQAAELLADALRL